jgi:chitinase
MKKFILLPLAIISLVTFNSCKKDDETEVENMKPTVTITSPTGDVYTGGTTASITITADVSDSDGTISKVQFYKNGGKIGPDDTSYPYSSIPGTYDVGTDIVFKVVATDNDGATTEKSVTVDIIQAP